MNKHNIIENAKKITVDAMGYHINKEPRQGIMKEYKEGKYNNVRNYYKEARELGYLDRDKPYAKELNRILWGFLLANRKSKNDLQILDTAIYKFNCATKKILKKIENTEEVLQYLRQMNYKSYLDFAQYFSDKYGIDVKEYMQAKANGFKINEEDLSDNIFLEKLKKLVWSSIPVPLSLVDYQFHLNEFSKDRYKYFSEYETIYNSARTLDIIMPILKENKEEFLRSPEDDYSVLKYKLKQKEIFPIYKKNYGLPTLQMIKSTNIILEFSILDDKIDIDHMIKEVYNKERKFHRITASSEKSGLLKALNYEEHKGGKLYSINALQKALIVYQYMQDGEEVLSPEEARHIFTFHAFLFAYYDKLAHTNSKDDNGTYRSRDVITYFSLKKEIKDQIKIIESLLNLNS